MGNRIRQGQARRQAKREDKLKVKTVHAQDQHFHRDVGTKGRSKWSKMVGRAGRSEKFRNRLNKVLTKNYSPGEGSGTYADPYSGGDIGSHLLQTEAIPGKTKKTKRKTPLVKQKRKVSTRI